MFWTLRFVEPVFTLSLLLRSTFDAVADLTIDEIWKGLKGSGQRNLT